MKKIRLFFSWFLTIAMVVAMTACGGNQTTKSSSNETTQNTQDSSSTSEPSADVQYNWQIGHALAVDHPYQFACEEFARLLNEYSDGAINMTVFPAGQLGGERDMYEGCQMGTVDFMVGTTSPLVNFDPSFNIFDMPFLFEDKEQAYKVLDGEFGQKKLDSLSSFGIKGLAFMECGFFNFVYSGDEIRTLSDMKARTIRTMESDVTMTWISSLGANPVPMAWAEVFTAIQNGTVDGTLLPITTTYYNKIYTVGNNYSMLNLTYSPLPLVMSDKLWKSLPEDIQEIIQRAAVESRDYMREYTTSVEDDALTTMIEEGTNVITFTEEERQVWVDYIKESVYPKLVPALVPQEDMDEVEAAK